MAKKIKSVYVWVEGQRGRTPSFPTVEDQEKALALSQKIGITAAAVKLDVNRLTLYKLCVKKVGKDKVRTFPDGRRTEDVPVKAKPKAKAKVTKAKPKAKAKAKAKPVTVTAPVETPAAA